MKYRLVRYRTSLFCIVYEDCRMVNVGTIDLWKHPVDAVRAANSGARVRKSNRPIRSSCISEVLAEADTLNSLKVKFEYKYPEYCI